MDEITTGSLTHNKNCPVVEVIVDEAGHITPAPVSGTWPENDLRRAFVAGAAWWEYHTFGATMWNSDRDDAEAEAERRYPDGKLR